MPREVYALATALVECEEAQLSNTPIAEALSVAKANLSAFLYSQGIKGTIAIVVGYRKECKTVTCTWISDLSYSFSITQRT